jgi:hypothetical protein
MKNRGHSYYIGFVVFAALMLAGLACTCGPLNGLTGGIQATVGAAGATFEAVSTQVQEELPTAEAAATQLYGQLTQEAPALNATMTAIMATANAAGQPPVVTGPGGAPVYDGGDGYETTLVQEITVGQTSAPTQINGLFEAHNWLFQGTAGQTVTIRVSGLGDCDPRFKLIDPNGDIIGDDDDSGGGANGYDALLTITLPMSGTYTVRVDVWSTGQYTVTVQ